MSDPDKSAGNALSDAGVEIDEADPRSGGNRSEAARRLGVSRVTVWKRMKKYRIEPEEFS